MNNRDKSALSLALAIVGGIAAGLRCDASVTVETSTQFNPRPAAYTVKAHTEGSDPFDAKDPSSINQYTPPVATPIKLSVCDGYDLSAFTSCLSKKAKKDNHAYSGKLCHEYIDEIIDACKKEQKK